MSTKKIEIRYFASVREALGKTTEIYETQAKTVQEVRAELAKREAPYQSALQVDKVLRTAVNHVMVPESTCINDGDEVAFFPPVTGG